MDAFENLVAMLLKRNGYWVQTSFKVELTKDEKRRIGRPTSPRWEIDIVAYKGATNEILIVECKSYLDSAGVKFCAFDGTNARLAKRFKLFNDRTLQNTVFRRLVSQLKEQGFCGKSPTVKLALAAGKIAGTQDHEKLKRHFDRKKWLLFDNEWFLNQLNNAAGSQYENDIALVVAKILLRNREIEK